MAAGLILQVVSHELWIMLELSLDWLISVTNISFPIKLPSAIWIVNNTAVETDWMTGTTQLLPLLWILISSDVFYMAKTLPAFSWCWFPWLRFLTLQASPQKKYGEYPRQGTSRWHWSVSDPQSGLDSCAGVGWVANLKDRRKAWSAT